MDTYNLVEAVEAGDAPGVGAALAAGADPNARLRGGATHLMRAAARGDLAVVRTLLEGGADAGAKRGDGTTALMLASFFGHAEVVAALLGAGADVCAEDAHGSTALSMASSKGHTGAAELLKRAAAAAGRLTPAVWVRDASPPSGGPGATAEVPPARGGSPAGRGRAAVASPPPGGSAGVPVRESTRAQAAVEVAVPPAGGQALTAPARRPGKRRRRRRLLLLAACLTVLLTAGLALTLTQVLRQPEAGRPAQKAVGAGAQPLNLLAPPSGQGEGAFAEPAAAAATPAAVRTPSDTPDAQGEAPTAAPRLEPGRGADPFDQSRAGDAPAPARKGSAPRRGRGVEGGRTAVSTGEGTSQGRRSRVGREKRRRRR